MNATIVPEMNIPNMDTYWSILKNLRNIRRAIVKYVLGEG